jgi:hypothetical protein
VSTRAVPVDHPGVKHEGCVYFAAVFHIGDVGDFWFCNKCGNGGELFPPVRGGETSG